ncbi:hypothetical protein EVAR_98733_1 [Eumeta japonica]|uniref:Uncharacterized protein n=1 Tax=Eumeta variegata TaxID=151549 RepID=A0A4C1ZK04_EUMVA|nr:hypothetical protein EVAR_98733_1 [Eumeta japonica]
MRCRSVSRSRCIKASEVHEVVVYENRGENLNYLLQRDQKIRFVRFQTSPVTSTRNHKNLSRGKDFAGANTLKANRKKTKVPKRTKTAQQEPKKGEEGRRSTNRLQFL